MCVCVCVCVDRHVEQAQRMVAVVDVAVSGVWLRTKRPTVAERGVAT